MAADSESSDRRTYALISTLPMFVLLASSDYDNSVASDDRSTLESAATLVHAFVSSRVDYCNVVFTGTPKIITDRLQRVLNAAARVVSDTRKFDHGLSRLMHTELHWLDVPERVQYKLGVLMYLSLIHI